MKKLFALVCLATLLASMMSCSDTETYADKRKKEDAAISQFIAYNLSTAKQLFPKPITVITEKEFEDAGYKTDVEKNEFVLFETSGVYMQIVRQGCGSKIESGETTTVLCRFNEYNILEDTLQLTNNGIYFQHIPDKMTVTNYYGTFTGTFVDGSSVMAAAYSSTSVPSGWLLPLRYVNVGRQEKPDEEIAKVNIIVPSSEGHYYASANTYPCYYELTYERGH